MAAAKALVVASGATADHRSDSLAIGEGPRHRGVAGHGVALVRRGIAGSRVNRDGCWSRSQGLFRPLQGLRVQPEGSPVAVRVQREEAHQTFVSLEAADPGRLDPGALRRKQERSLAGEGPRVADASGRPGEARQDPALQYRVEVENQIEAPASKLRQKAPGNPPGAHQPPLPQTLPEHPTRKQDHLVDPGLSLHDAHGGGLEQPRDVRARVGSAQGRDRGKRAHHVAHGSEANHENPIGPGRIGERIRAGGDGEPRGGG